jgi:hypothetical protein
MNTPLHESITFETRDEYYRKPIADRLLKLLTSGTHFSPMVIDGQWGSGKTEFCYKLKNMIDNSTEHKYRAIYIDAFRADHADEPLMTLMSAILKIMPEMDRQPLIQQAIPALRVGIKTGLNAGVSWLLKTDTASVVSEYQDILKSSGDDAINLAIESLLKDHIKAEESIETLKVALAKLAKSTPLIIFVDELDRCRPDFAVNMLESIKHVFDVDGVQFLLVANMDQLRASINHCYGQGIDSQRYLDKFLKFSFTIPHTYHPQLHSSFIASEKHLELTIKSNVLLNKSHLKEEGSLEFLKILVNANRLSLREVETFVRYLDVYQVLTNATGFQERLYSGYLFLRASAVFIYCFKPDMSASLLYGNFYAKDMANIVGKNKLFDINSGKYPDFADVFVAMISQESAYTSTDYSFYSEEIKNQWNRLIAEYFGGAYRPEAGKMSKIMVQTIRVLMLSGDTHV